MTYLELVNAVLRRLREEQVSTVNDTDYSQLIGDFVNDAKRVVEDAWDWTALRYTYTITTTTGVDTYTLTDYGVRSKLMYIDNESLNSRLNQEALQRLKFLNLGTSNNQGPPMYYAISSVDSNGDCQIVFHQIPDSDYTLSVYTVKRRGDLTEDSDELLIPTSPVIQWAYSYALRERGETGGQSSAEQALFAQNELTNSIALDAGQHPDETIWYTP